MPEVAQATETIFERVAAVRRRIEASAQHAGRAPEEVKLIAVTKTHPVEIVRAALAAGLSDFGENRVQEADAKIAALAESGGRWHLIGHLQTNKARRAVKLFDVIHTVDTPALVARLLAGEETKSGVDVAVLPEIIEQCHNSERVRLIGLMTLPPYLDEVELVRPYFRRLRELRDEWQARGAFGAHTGELSMGMTHDFEVAIAEGATMVRVGTAIFGARK